MIDNSVENIANNGLLAAIFVLLSSILTTYLPSQHYRGALKPGEVTR
jgi:hypothetical protein